MVLGQGDHLLQFHAPLFAFRFAVSLKLCQDQAWSVYRRSLAVRDTTLPVDGRKIQADAQFQPIRLQIPRAI
jgi:hypothetical protein